MQWIFFALMAPFLWAFGAIILKFMRVKYIKSPIGYLVFVAPVTILSLTLLFFEPFRNPGLSNIIIAILSGIIAMVGYYLFIYVLHKEDISRVITLYGISPLFVLLLATIFLKEILLPKDYIAFFLIILGALLISAKNEEGRLRVSKGVLLIVLSSFVWAVHNILLKIASSTNFSTMMILRQVGILIFVLLALALSKNAWVKTKQTIKEFGFKRGALAYTAESLGMAGMVFSYLAIQMASVSLVTLVEGIQPLFIIFIAVVMSIFFPKIIKETIDKKTVGLKVISALLMLSGLYLIVI